MLAMVEGGNEVSVDGSVYSVSCASSSDFVVGKQTNFHAPVTIINCPVPKYEETPENIVIKDHLWSSNTPRALQSNLSIINPELNLNVKNENGSQRKLTPASQKIEWNFSAKSLHLAAQRNFIGLPIFLWFLIFFFIICSVITASIILLKNNSIETIIPTTDDKIYIGDPSHVFFNKQMWGGLNASSKIEIDEPTTYVLISHTVTAFCYENKTCQDIVRIIQKDHMSRTPAFADIAVSFLVGGDGNVYEGRGWGIRSPHEGFINNKNIDISFIGDFSVYDAPTSTQVDAVKKLIERGVRDCHLSSNYVLIAHNSTARTLSPGKNVYSIISKWDHFDPDPVNHLKKHMGMDRVCADVAVPYSANKTDS